MKDWAEVTLRCRRRRIETGCSPTAPSSDSADPLDSQWARRATDNGASQLREHHQASESSARRRGWHWKCRSSEI